jgi:5-methylcytosine-specific restriction enzyme A
MPQRAKQICRAPGCGAVCDGAYCPQHLTATQRRQFDRYRGSSASRGYGHRWRKLRRMVLARDLVCKIGVLCQGTALATEVDHIVPKSKGGDDSMENLQGACHACHSHKTATEDSGFARTLAPGG